MPLKYIPQIKKFKNWLIDNPDVIEARRSGATNSLYKSEFTNEMKNVLLPYIKGFIKKNPLNIKKLIWERPINFLLGVHRFLRQREKRRGISSAQPASIPWAHGSPWVPMGLPCEN